MTCLWTVSRQTITQHVLATHRQLGKHDNRTLKAALGKLVKEQSND